MRKLFFLAVTVLCLQGCFGERRQQAQVLANIYAAAAATQEMSLDPRIIKTQTAIRLSAEKLANQKGYSIEGAQSWTQSLQRSPQMTGSPMLPQP